MPLVLRIDVDKPYGRSTLVHKIISKVREDYWFPAYSSWGYLNHLVKYLDYLSKHNINAHIYFRKCTLPPKSWLDKSVLHGHMIGFHAENTKSYEVFSKDLNEVISYVAPYKINSFTKHGSGRLKLGRYHYPPYEPEKYLEWAKITGTPFYFGNEEKIEYLRDDYPQDHYYPGMFWIERYRNDKNAHVDLRDIIDIAMTKNVIVITHPGNIIDDKQIAEDMSILISLAHRHNVPWITIE